MNSRGTIAAIALPVALPEPLSYRVPQELEGRLRRGHRVRVPLRGRITYGYVLDLYPGGEGAPLLAGARLKEIAAIEPDQVLLSPALLKLTHWLADYYLAPIGMALEAAVPRGVARPPRARKGALPGDIVESALEAGRPEAARTAPPVLNPAQEAAVAQITAAVAAGSATTFLLQGVTASGKTEVYLQAAAAALARGRSVLFLVPEIALGTIIVRWVRQRFGELVAEYHSQLRPAVRRATWWAAQEGRARVVVGARSAVFAPLRDLGLVVIDEEHEPSYKQEETPRYHGRDTALMRARIEGAVAVLGSATPALESHANAVRGKYVHLRLPERVDDRPRAKVTLVDMRADSSLRGESPAGLEVVGAGAHDPQEPLCAPLLTALQRIKEEGNQAILFLNRRGFATCVQCRECGHVFACPDCSVVLTHHRAARQLRCHYCNHTVGDAVTCPGCGGADFAFRGAGTQRVESALARRLPQLRVLRMDVDSTRKRGASAGMIAAFERGEADVLLGTQMVAKGFDFPSVTLVGVINADREMGFPDFRGQERAFQLLTQVAGRAGRGKKPGMVIFQTYLPDHHVIAAAARQDYEAFCATEMEERRVFGYPPHRRMANLLFDGPEEETVIRVANAAADRLRDLQRVAVLGPAPMPLSRLKGQFRWHLTLIAPGARPLTSALQMALTRERKRRRRARIRVQVDMDPVSML